MTPLVVAGLLFSACQRAEAPANNQAAAAPAPAKASQPEGDVSRAERLVREQLGNPAGVTFAVPQRTASEGVRIVCGEYRQGNARNRYIVVDGERVFVEPRMRPGEMDRAYVEFCRGERG